jgi:hypothetical protein
VRATAEFSSYTFLDSAKPVGQTLAKYAERRLLSLGLSTASLS